ncbi:hypothetical protein [Micromonospora profundi]|uniref:hypothetical protein n=1 Tax=Micromonospora profundi TaxID=1420889 RepID=UPI00364B3175
MTVRPPWSWAIAEAEALTAIDAGPKLVENRGRKIPDRHIGQRIAIHAGLTWCKAGENDYRVRAAWNRFANAIDLRTPNPKLAEIGDMRTGYVGRLQPSPQLWLDTGAVAAVATLADCHQSVGGCCAPWGDAAYATKAGTVAAWHLVLADVRRLREPVPCRGQVRVPWDLPEVVADQVDAQLAKQVAR